MLTVEKVYSEDFEKVLELLNLFNNNDIDKVQWQRLFNPVCKRLNNDFFGFALVAENKFIGFIAGIQSQREIKGKTQNFCNISSWIVHPDYRKEKKGLLLLKALMEIENLNFYVLSPVRHTFNYYISLYGFKENTSKFYTIPAFPSIRKLFINTRLTVNTDNIKGYLNNIDIELLNDHQLPNIFHFLFFYKGEYIYCIIKKTAYSSYILNSSFIINFFTKAWFKVFKKDFFNANIFLGLVHYTNKPKLFSESLTLNINKICKIMKVQGLSINDKYLLNKPLIKIKNNINYAGIYKSNELDQNDFDTLYSELTHLNLKHFQL